MGYRSLAGCVDDLRAHGRLIDIDVEIIDRCRDIVRQRQNQPQRAFPGEMFGRVARRLERQVGVLGNAPRDFSRRDRPFKMLGQNGRWRVRFGIGCGDPRDLVGP